MTDLAQERLRQAHASLRRGTEVLTTGGGTTLSAVQCEALLEERDRLLEALDESLSYRRAGRMPQEVLARLRAVRNGAS